MDLIAGRSCPLHYRYGAAALARMSAKPVATLYVIGGLYGNLPALDAIEAMVAQESGPVTLCFNGDFNWFNVDADGFAEINRRVLQYDAIVGNVEAELDSSSADAGCGCAYPETVDQAVVERSNRIHSRLKATAAQFPAILAQLAALPLFARYQVGACRVGVVHGDADSLAGWRFDPAALDAPGQALWLNQVFEQACVDLFASTHTCAAGLRSVGGGRAIINNGAAGMPNFSQGQFGVLTRIGSSDSPHAPLYGTRQGDVRIDALPVAYDNQRWQDMFLRNWPAQSDAHQSYFQRIVHGTRFTPEQAMRVLNPA